MANLDLRRLLIVDDEEEIRNIIKEATLQENIEALEAENGEEALGLIKSNPITGILCDISMPKMNGVEFLAKVREAGFGTPILFLTAYDSKVHLEEAIRLGAFDFITKPFELKDVENSIYRLLDLGARIQEINNLDPSTTTAEKLKEKIVAMNRLQAWNAKNQRKVSNG